MSRNLVIEGERYTGIFNGARRSGTFEGGSEYSTYTYTAYWYEGSGIIKDKNKRRYFFAYKTECFRESYCTQDEDWLGKNYSLEESIVHFNQKGPFSIWDPDFKPVVVDGMYKKIVDLSLREMIGQVNNSENDIPIITPKRLELKDLVERGFCADKNGQICFPFAKI